MNEKEMLYIPPYSEEAERGLLGSLMVDAERVYGLCVSRGVSSEMFHIPAHRLVYEQIVNMRRKNLPVDLLLLGEELKKSKRLDQCGGYGFLEGLIDTTPTSAHAQWYLDVVMQKFALRQWMQTGQGIIEMVQADQLEEIPAYVFNQDAKITKALNADQLKVDEIHVSTEALKDRIRLKQPVIRKVASAINTVRNRIVGYPLGRMTVIGCRPGVGKTALACTEVLSMALNEEPVSVLTFEMSSDEYTARMACIRAEVDLERYIDGKLSDEEIQRMEMALDEIARLPIRISDRSMNIMQLQKWMLDESKFSRVIVVDHFLLIRHMSKKGERESSIYGEWSRIISGTAKTLNVAAIVLTQLRRFDLRDKQGNLLPPTKNLLKETGCLEEDAYLLLLIHDHPVKRDNVEIANYQLIVDKHRNGWSGIIPVQFIKQYAKFEGIGYV